MQHPNTNTYHRTSHQHHRHTIYQNTPINLHTLHTLHISTKRVKNLSFKQIILNTCIYHLKSDESNIEQKKPILPKRQHLDNDCSITSRERRTGPQTLNTVLVGKAFYILYTKNKNFYDINLAVFNSR